MTFAVLLLSAALLTAAGWLAWWLSCLHRTGERVADAIQGLRDDQRIRDNTRRGLYRQPAAPSPETQGSPPGGEPTCGE